MSEYIDSLYLRTVMKNRIHYALFALISCSSPLLGWTHTFHNQTPGKIVVLLHYTDLLSTSRENYYSLTMEPNEIPASIDVGPACIKKITILGETGSVNGLCAYYDIPLSKNRCAGHSYTITYDRMTSPENALKIEFH